MIQFLLILLGFINPDNSTKAIHTNQSTTQSNTNIGDELDTSGENGQTPPRK